MQYSSQWGSRAQQLFSSSWKTRQAAKVLHAPALVASSSSGLWSFMQLEIQNPGWQTMAQIVLLNSADIPCGQEA